MAYEDIKNEICDVCHKMWQLGWVAANDGNVTVKLEDGTFLATPTGISKSFITPEKLVRIDAEGNILEANEGYRPSSEIKMHLRCYKDRDDVGAVLHAHPPTATGFAVAHVPLDRYDMIETVVALGSIPITPYGTPSTYEVPEAIAPYKVIVIPVNTQDELQMKTATEIYESLKAKGVEVVIDDRDDRAGVKFKDADLIGFPYKIVVGKSIAEGKVELKKRTSKEAELLTPKEAVEKF